MNFCEGGRLMRSRTIQVPEPRRYDCVNYSRCLREAAIKNYHGNLCSRCDSYSRLSISDAYLQTVSLSTKGDYIRYELT